MPLPKPQISLTILKYVLVLLITNFVSTMGFIDSECFYDTKTHVLDCKNLVEIPRNVIWQSATHMYIDNSRIPVLHNEAFSTFPAVQEISIQNSGVQSVEQYALKGLEFLEYLHLRNNNIQTFSSVFLPQTLQFLDISNNLLDSTDESPFPKSASDLVTLYCNDAGLKEMTASDVQGMTGLLRWRMMRNDLTSLNLDVLVGLEKISSIDVEFNRIEKIVPMTEGRKLEHLTFLDVGYNLLTSLDENVFRGLPALQELRLHDNPLVIPTNTPFLSHTTISRITLSRINAAALSKDTFKNLPQLLNIELIDSKITDISNVFSELQHLQFLNLRNNLVDVIRKGTFSQSGTLEQLILDHNPLAEFETDAVVGVMTRGVIDISYTPLACTFKYILLNSWCEDNGVVLRSVCSSTINPACNYDEECVVDEHCCTEKTCSKNGKCSGASLTSFYSFALLTLAITFAFLNESC